MNLGYRYFMEYNEGNKTTSEKLHISGLEEGDLVFSKNKPKSSYILRNRFYMINVIRNKFLGGGENLYIEKQAEISGVSANMNGAGNHFGNHFTVITFSEERFKQNFHVGRYLLTEKQFLTTYKG